MDSRPQVDVAAELEQSITNKMREIVSELNLVGHQLKENEPEGPEDTDFCELHNDENSDSCGFRLGTPLTVSSGYYNIGEDYG